MMASLAELTDNPFVQNTIDSVALRDATDLPKTRIIVRPQNTPDNEPVKQDDSKLQNIIDHLFGLNGKERYQLWPERLIRDAISAPHDVMTGEIPQYVIDPVTGEAQTSPQMIKAGVDASSLAGSGGLAGAGSEAGVALGSAPFLRPALKYGEKLYKGKPGQQHMDVIPADLYPTFQKQAMSGEDISNFNFGFLNHKGQFLSREDALKYAIDNGLVDPHSAQYGALTSTLMSDTAKPGAAINALAKTNYNTDLINAAKNHFGLTKNPKEAGYVMPDGSMLDFSGRHYADYTKQGDRFVPKKGSDYLKDQRNVDHRELHDIMDAPVNSITGQSDNNLMLSKFMNDTGAIRNQPGIGFETSVIPTDKQIKNIVFGHNSSFKGEPLKVDLSSPSGEVYSSFDFNKPNVDNVKKWINANFRSDTSRPGAALAAVANTNKIHPELEATLVKAYNNRLPSYEDQYYKWAGKDSDYQILNKKTAEDIYGDPSDWPKEINDAFKKSDEIVAISDGNNFEVLPKTEAKTYQQHIKDTVESQNGLHHATDLDDIMNGLKTQTEGAEGAASDAFKELAKSQGWEVGNGHRYFDIRRGDDVKHVRISDHPNLTKSNPNAIIPDINIAPGAHDFHDAFKMLKSDNEAGIGVGVLAQTNKPFYSAVENAVAAAKQPKADAQQWISFLKNQPGVKQEELAHLGLDKLQGSITKDDLLKAVQEGQPQIKEVMKGGKTAKDREAELEKLGDERTLQQENELNDIRDGNWQGEHGINATKYHSYQLPGGENYREMLLTLPDKQKRLHEWEYFDPKTQTSKQFKTEAEAKAAAPEGAVINQKEVAELNPSYKSSHWDEPNVLAHIRMNDRMIDGKKTLHLEEIQSDWHQAGRKSGYESDFKIPDRTALRKQMDEIRALAPPDLDTMGKMQWLESQPKYVELRNEFNRQVPSGMSEAVPDAPFKKTWDELALKKAITEAVKNGYDQISWTPGEAQAARYDLSKQLKELQYLKNDDGTYEIAGIKSNGDGFNHPDNVTADKLPDIVGKEMAEKIIKNEGKRARGHPSNGGYFDGIDLKVGGQGMKAFYDKMLVDKMNALTKKYGGKVTQSELPPKLSNKIGEPPIKQPVHVLKITPELREQVLKKGLPLFSAGVPVFTPVEGNPFEGNK